MRDTIMLFVFLLISSVLYGQGPELVNTTSDAMAISLSMDGKFLYVVGRGRTIDIINVETKAIEKTLDLPFPAAAPVSSTAGICVDKKFGIVVLMHGILANSVVDNAFLIDPETDNIRIIALNSRIGRARMGFFDSCAVGSDGLLYLASGSNTNYTDPLLGQITPKISIVDAELNIVKNLVITSDGVGSLTSLPNEDKIYAVVPSGGVVAVISGKEVTKMVAFPFGVKPGNLTLGGEGVALIGAYYVQGTEQATYRMNISTDDVESRSSDFWTVEMRYGVRDTTLAYGASYGAITTVDVQSNKSVKWIPLPGPQMIGSLQIASLGDEDRLFFRQGTQLFALGMKRPAFSLRNLTNSAASAGSFAPGDNFQAEFSSTLLNSPVYLHLWKDGVDWGVSGPYGKTDLQGRWSISGTYGAADAGIWKVQAIVGKPDAVDRSRMETVTISPAP